MKMLPGKYIYPIGQPIGNIIDMFVVAKAGWSRRLCPIELQELTQRHALQKRRGIPEYVCYDKSKNRMLLHPVPISKGTFFVRFTPPIVEI